MLDIKKPATGLIGAEVFIEAGGHSMTSEWAHEIKQLVYAHKLVIMRGVELSASEYVEFARKFGEPQIYFQAHYHHPEHPEIFVSANVPYQGEKFGVAGTGRYWHSDYQFFEEPLPMTMIYPQEFFSGRRSTSFIDLERALRELPDSMRSRLIGARMRHDAKLCVKIQASDIDKSIAEVIEEAGRLLPPISHPAVITHPVTGRPCLYASPGFSDCPEELDPAEGRVFMAEVFERVAREERIHVQPWQEGDILLWDNRTVMHRSNGTLNTATKCINFRIGIYDGLPFYVEAPLGCQTNGAHSP